MELQSLCIESKPEGTASNRHRTALRDKIREIEQSYLQKSGDPQYADVLIWHLFEDYVADICPNSTTYVENPNGRPFYNLVKTCQDHDVVIPAAFKWLKQCESDSTSLPTALAFLSAQCYQQIVKTTISNGYTGSKWNHAKAKYSRPSTSIQSHHGVDLPDPDQNPNEPTNHIKQRIK